jgi:hypothetical protein
MTPVTHAEVRIARGTIITMPTGTYQYGRRWIILDGHRVNAGLEARGIPALWQPLIDELEAGWQAIHAALDPARKKRFAAVLEAVGGGDGGRREPFTVPVFFEPDEDTCLICNRSFIFKPRLRYVVALCSDDCVRVYRNEQNNFWYHKNKPWVNYNRDTRREEARVGLCCLHCGAVLTAERSTARYCDVNCRVAAFRTRNGNG